MALRTEIDNLRNDRGREVKGPLNALIEGTVAQYPAGLGILYKLDELQGGSEEVRVHHALVPYVYMTDQDLIKSSGELSGVLKGLGALDLSLGWQWVDLEGQKQSLMLVSALSADDIEVSHNMTGIWVRDSALIAQGLLRENINGISPRSGLQNGEDTLLGMLDCMSTPKQLARFDNVIAKDGKVKPEDHPSIKFDLQRDSSDKLAEATLDTETKWGHDQDAWQMLGAISLKAFEEGALLDFDLTDHAAFFKRIPHFLKSVDWLNRASRGSWEEIAAKGRLSTTAWEFALLVRLRKQSALFGFDPETVALMDNMIREGGQTILRRFPQEARDEPETSPAHRKADAAILYFGMAEVPELLEEYGFTTADIPDDACEEMLRWKNSKSRLRDVMYTEMFDSAESLHDSWHTGGMMRYKQDSYQASLFWTDPCWNALAGPRGLWGQQQFKDKKGHIHFAGRAQLLQGINMATTPPEAMIHNTPEEARWMHPVVQAATIALRLATQSPENPYIRAHYLSQGLQYVRSALKMITAPGEFTIRPGMNGLEVVPMKAGIAPECYVANRMPDGRIVRHVGPWGPLSWSAGSLREMLAWMQKAQAESI